MANFNTHLYHGMIAGAGFDLVKQLVQMSDDSSRRFDWGELLLYAGIGAVAVSIPDILEPATSPNHRGFCHSILFGAVLLYIAYGPHTKNLSSQMKNILQVAIWSYLTHLLVDGQTPKGLPIC